MVEGGRPIYHLERALESYRVVQHGVALGIGGPSEPDRAYLQRLKKLVRKTGTPWVSDHFCWSGAGGAHLHDLLPMPYTAQAVERIVQRARMVQDFLEVRFALENTSSYLTYKSSVLSEWEFIAEIAERAGIGLLFDVNNVFVSAYNHGFDPVEFIERVPHQRIVQVHLAGHTNLGDYIIDTHRGQVSDAVLDLYELLIRRAGPVSTLIEWDDEIPEFQTLWAEAERARTVRERALSARATGPAIDAELEQRLQAVRALARAGSDAAGDEAHGWKQGGPRENASADGDEEAA
jgi:uncharacterized protein (UPF0276 family)